MEKDHKSYQQRVPAAHLVSMLSIVHLDTCGPFRTLVVSRAKYLILFIDDFTSMTWVYFLKGKGHKETLETLRTFKALVEKASGHPIHRFLCDIGRGKYNNQCFTDFLKVEGISFGPTAVYTQNQNRLSEKDSAL